MSKENLYPRSMCGVHRKGDISIDSIIQSIKKHPRISEVGAIGIFVGVVREKSTARPKGEPSTTLLELEAWEEEANKKIKKICQDESSTRGVVDVQIHHFLGKFKPHEDVVYVSVAGSHRKEVFTTLRECVERYKHEAPIWKKEHTSDGKATWSDGEHTRY